jgi:hypothetical protein
MAGRDQMQGPMDQDEYSKLRGQDLSQIAVEHPADPRKHRPAPPAPDIDWDFIKAREGMRLDGYVPEDKKPNCRWVTAALPSLPDLTWASAMRAT